MFKLPEGDSQNTDPAAVTPGVARAPSDAAQAFISYASADSATANAICAALERDGVKCWIAPRDVTPGELYAANIVHAIDTTRAVVLVLSQHAADSAHVLREVERAASKRHPILSFRVDQAPLPDGLEYFLNTSQWLDASAIGVDRALPRLVDAVRGAVSKPTAAASVNQTPLVAAKASTRPNRMLLTLAVLIVAALAFVGVDRLWLSKRVGAQVALVETQPASPVDSSEALAIPDKSIAVLPFADMSEKKDQEYMSDGIAEELLNLLVQIPDLKVIARTSSFAFKGQSIEIDEIAKKLNVAHVLEGSVRKSGNKLRITAQLIRTADSTHLWSESYDRPLDDIFAVQEEIAEAIVQALRVRLLGTAVSSREGGTENFEAYQFYLQAVSEFNLATGESLASAEKLLKQAIRLDPNYGRAWSRLGWVAYSKSTTTNIPAIQAYKEGRQCAERALQLNPQLADAHALLQIVFVQADQNWVAAESEGRKALAIDPSNPEVLFSAAWFASIQRRYEEGERLYRKALDRDPLNFNLVDGIAENYYRTGQLADAERILRTHIEREPRSEWSRAMLSRVLLVQGNPDAALAMILEEVDEGARISYLPIMLQGAGKQAEADVALKKLVTYWASGCAICIARTYAYRGENDRAMDWLEHAYRLRDSSIMNVIDEPLLRSFANDQRYKAFVRDKLKVPG